MSAAKASTRAGSKAKSKKAAKKSKRKIRKGSCFTIMPFGGWFDDYYDNIYQPAIEEAGLVARRADDIYRPGTIVSDIWACTNEAKIVLADLSGKNPNVFYELGLAHALAKPAVLVTESLADVPFDLRALRVLEYDKNKADWGETLHAQITQAIKEVLVSPLDAVLPAFLEVTKQGGKKKIDGKDKAVLQLRQEVDLLRGELQRTRERGRRPENVIGREEARAMIAQFLEMGLPPGRILDRLSQMGVSRLWTHVEIEKKLKGGKRKSRSRK